MNSWERKKPNLSQWMCKLDDARENENPKNLSKRKRENFINDNKEETIEFVERVVNYSEVMSEW